MKQVKHIIAVASGKGGVGKSTTAVNLALALRANGAVVGLLDADIYGPSQQIMLGIAEGTRPEQQDGQWLLPIVAHGLQTMSMGYLVTEKTPMVWRGPMAGGALQQMLEQTLWGALDCRRTVQTAGGTMSVEETSGGGATFLIVLPTASPGTSARVG